MIEQGLPDLRVLGPIEVVGPAGPAALLGGRQRAVLAALALHPGTMLPFTRLVDALWGEDPPRTAVKTLHSHVARIRQALAACGLPPMLVTREPGYVLTAARSSVDAHLFTERVERARTLRAGGSLDDAAAELRAAVALWRGDALADAPVEGWAAGEVDRLHELRLSTLEELFDVEVWIGRQHEVLNAVSGLQAEHPTRERLTGIYMLALYRAGRQAEALAAYQRLRRTLADQLGVDPGPEVSELHTAILRRDSTLDAPPAVPITTASTAIVPAQLPARVGHFTGRDDEIRALDTLLATEDDLPIAVICGPAGMGKTSLAIQWAHQATRAFPDGHLFLDLRGHDPKSALSGDDALTHILHSLDVPDDRMPTSPQEKSALYRTLVSGRRFLIVVDNVGRADDVLPLVPSGRNLLVVTSRSSLAALSTRHALRVIAVDALTHDAAISLLGSVLGVDRVEREADPAAWLARLCGGMPLALRIAAARLVGHPKRPIAEFAAELDSTAGRLDSLAVEGDARTVRAVLASAYHPLAAQPATLFRRLGLHPGPTFSTHLGAAVCGVDRSVGGHALDELSIAHLVTAVGADRYRFHDLTRVFARQCATPDEPADVGERLFDWYLLIAHRANQLVNPARDVVTPTIRFPDAIVPFEDDQHAALAFLDAERDNFLPVVQHARETGRLAHAWELTYLLTSFYEATGHWHERIDLCRQGAAAAADLGDPRAESEMLRALGVAFFMTRRLQDALDTNTRALAVVRRAGDLAGEGHIHNNIANAYAELRRFDDAITAHQQAVDRCAEAGNELGLALSRRNLGHTYIRMGKAELSVPPLSAALKAFRDLGIARLEANTLDTLGEAYLQREDFTLALHHFDSAVAISRDIGDRWLEWETLLDAGLVHLARKDFPAAVDHFRQALAITRDVGDRHSEASVLNQLGRTHLLAGDLTAARHHLELAGTVRARVPDHFEEAHLHRDLADLAARTGDPAAAADHRSRAVRLYQQANATAEAEALTAAE
ncbi:BTAD domain-containing putative transcriptional regulator [Actinokineospora sp.]|uniref:BTAD domain-containing putative transcriptional regulator n=1 Tax=Actinokineospora sp. TaxID=1872133 RepID=UPI0040380ECE